MEYKGLWEEETQKESGTIYIVVELYDWHNDVPGFEINVFLDLGDVQDFIKKRVKEISLEVFDEDDVDWNEEDIEREYYRVKSEKYYSCDTVCLTDENDYVHLFLFKDKIHQHIFC